MTNNRLYITTMRNDYLTKEARAMTKVGQKYKCNICGNEVVVTNAGAGELVCCGQPMENIGEGFACK